MMTMKTCDDYDGFHYNDDDNAFGSKGRLGTLEFE
jgi:hypothetical protein